MWEACSRHAQTATLAMTQKGCGAASATLGMCPFFFAPDVPSADGALRSAADGAWHAAGRARIARDGPPGAREGLVLHFLAFRQLRGEQPPFVFEQRFIVDLEENAKFILQAHGWNVNRFCFMCTQETAGSYGGGAPAADPPQPPHPRSTAPDRAARRRGSRGDRWGRTPTARRCEGRIGPPPGPTSDGWVKAMRAAGDAAILCLAKEALVRAAKAGATARGT
eukprot:gene9794-7631_t